MRKLYLLLLLIIPEVALTTDAITDIYFGGGREPRRVVLTVDPGIEIWRFQQYVFANHDLDERKYVLVTMRKKPLSPDDTLRDYNSRWIYPLHLMVLPKADVNIKTCNCENGSER